MFYGGGDKTKVNPANSPIGHPFGVKNRLLGAIFAFIQTITYQDGSRQT
jgi:hypothetical protein